MTKPATRKRSRLTAAADAAGTAAGVLAAKAHARSRKAWHELTHPHKCSGCGKEFRYLRAHKAHALRDHAGRWAGAAARKAGRQMGKANDLARRHAVGWLEAAGLREWKTVPVRDRNGKERTGRDGKPVMRQVPVKTARAKERPELRGFIPLRTLRHTHVHDTSHERAVRADDRADRHDTATKGHAAASARHAVQGHAVRALIHRLPAEFHTRRADTHDGKAKDARERASRAARAPR
jgi:hypothetical protein